jgi:hypothetical protein
MPAKGHNVVYPQLPVGVLETIRQAWRKSTAGPLNEGWIEKICGCKPGSSRRYRSDLLRMGLLTDDSEVSPRGFDWAVEEGDENHRAALEVLGACWPEELKQHDAGKFKDYAALRRQFRRIGYKTDTAGGNIARLFCYFLEQAGKPLPPGAPDAKKRETKRGTAH